MTMTKPLTAAALAALVGTLSVTAAMAVLATGAAAGSTALVVVGLVLSGAGNGITRPPFASSVANAVDDSDLGIASAAQNVGLVSTPISAK